MKACVIAGTAVKTESRIGVYQVEKTKLKHLAANVLQGLKAETSITFYFFYVERLLLRIFVVR